MHFEFGQHLYGGATQVQYLIKELADSGIENILVCPVDSAISRVTCAKKVIEIPITGDLDIRLPFRLKRLIGFYNPNVVHVHSRRGADIMGGWAARSMAVPAVLTRRVDSRELALLARFKYSLYQAVVAISSAIEQELLVHVGLNKSLVYNIPSAVNTERYSPKVTRNRLATEAGFQSSNFMIGVVAQLIPRKGHRLLFDCLPELLEQFPQVRVLCFGNGQLENKLKQELLSCGLQSYVRFLGFRTDLIDLLPELDLLVHPAKKEGLGVAVMEAMSAGVPVISSNAGGLPDLLKHEIHGLLFKSDDRHSLLDALRRMISEEGLRHTFKDAARSHALQSFSIKQMSSHYIELYKHVLRSS
tara:strand:- start:798 stop:1874 length:1077 start_codon:yes stop_codon:yes gene_type:complete